MRFLNKFILVFFIIGASLNVVADQATELVSNALNKNFVAQFSLQITDLINSQTQSAKGKFFYKKGGLMRFEYEEPSDMLFIIGMKKIWIYDLQLKNVTIKSIDDIPQIDSLVFFRQPELLPKLFHSVDNTNHLILKAMTNQKLFLLKPYDASNQLSEIQLVYNPETRLIEQLGIIDQNNNTRIFKFSEFEFPLDILDNKFEFIIPKNVEIIE